MTTEERLKQLNDIYNHLRVIGKVTTKKDMADMLGLHPSTLSSAFSGDARYLTDNLFLLKVGSAFPEIFEPLWLHTGKGEMLRRNTSSQSMGNVSGLGIQAQGNACITMPQISGEESLEAANIRLAAENETLKREVEWLRNTLTQLLNK